MRACPKPFVAAVHGYALAGGFELALICDVRFAARGTQFGLPDTPLGLSPTSGMTWLLPRIVGLGRAMYLTLSADSIDADEARADRAGRSRDRARRPPRRGGGLRPAAGVVSRGSGSRGRSSASTPPSRATSRRRPGARRRPSSRASGRPRRASGSGPSSSANAARTRTERRPAPVSTGSGAPFGVERADRGGDPSAHDRRADVLVEAEQVGSGRSGP